MDAAEIKKLVLQFNKTRGNLLLVIAFTAVNLFLSAFRADYYLLFSATAPQFIYEVGRSLSQEYQNGAYMTIGLVVAFVVILLYLICWALAKRSRAFILVALILFGVDSILFVYLFLAAGFEASYLLDVAFHVWILYYLISGVIVWARLRGVSADEINAALQEASTPSPQGGALTGNGTIGVSQSADPVKDRATPLRSDDKRGRILIGADYAGLQISMKRTRALTELIINGNVYDEIKGSIETDYSLTGIVQNITIVGTFDAARAHMYLYADSALIAKKLRLY